MDCNNVISQGKTFLGIEFGSTRIKAVLIDAKGTPWPPATTAGKTAISTTTGPTPWRRSGPACGTPTPSWPPMCRRSTASP